MKIHDIHIHTTLSRCCSDPNATPENYLRLGQSRGMTVMGISNHFWDSDVPGSSDWYRVQNFEYISQVKYAFPYEQLNRMGIRLLFGCEPNMPRVFWAWILPRPSCLTTYSFPTLTPI